MIKMKVEKRGRANPHPTKILHQNVSLESISHFFRGKSPSRIQKKLILNSVALVKDFTVPAAG